MPGQQEAALFFADRPALIKVQARLLIVDHDGIPFVRCAGSLQYVRDVDRNPKELLRGKYSTKTIRQIAIIPPPSVSMAAVSRRRSLATEKRRTKGDGRERQGRDDHNRLAGKARRT